MGGMKLYMFVPAIFGGVFVGILLWLITIFTIRSYGALKAWMCPPFCESVHQQREGMQLKKLDLKRIPVSGEHMEISMISPAKQHQSFKPPLGAATAFKSPIYRSPIGLDNNGYVDNSEDESWLVSGGGEGIVRRQEPNSVLLIANKDNGMVDGHVELSRSIIEDDCCVKDDAQVCKARGISAGVCAAAAASGGSQRRRRRSLSPSGRVDKAEVDSSLTSGSSSSGIGNSEKASLNDSKLSLDWLTATMEGRQQTLRKEIIRKSSSLTSTKSAKLSRVRSQSE